MTTTTTLLRFARFARFARSVLLACLTVGSVLAIGGGAPTAAGDLPWPDRRFAPCGASGPGRRRAVRLRWRPTTARRITVTCGRSTSGCAESTRPSWSLAAAPAGPGATAVAQLRCDVGPDGQQLVVFGGWNGATHDRGVRTFDPATGTVDALCIATSCGVGPARRAGQPGGDRRRSATRARVRRDQRLVLRRPLVARRSTAAQWTRFDSPGPRPDLPWGHSMVIDAGRDAAVCSAGPGRARISATSGASTSPATPGTPSRRRARPAARRRAPAPRSSATRPTIASSSTAAGSRRRTSTTGRRGRWTSWMGRRSGHRSSRTANRHRPASSTSPGTTRRPSRW